MAGKECDVCGGESVGVASSALGAISFAYCARCLRDGLEPYSMLVITMEFANITKIDDCKEWLRDVINDTLVVVNKTVDEFHDDVKKHFEVMKEEYALMEAAMDIDDMEDVDDFEYEDDPFFK